MIDRQAAVGVLRRYVWVPAALIGAVGLAWVITAIYGDLVVTRVVTLALLHTVWVVGLFAYSGNSGMMSFGHVSFAALGAYATAYLTIPAGLKPTVFPDMPGYLSWLLDIQASFPVALLVSGLVAALFALVLAPAIVRLAPLQGAIATLSLLIIVHTVLNNWTEVTRGQSTMIGVPADLGLGGAAIGAMGAIAIAWALTSSGAGLRLRASREDAIPARAVGVAIGRERTVAWVTSAFILGVGGGMYTHFVPTFNPDQFFLAATFTIVAMLIIGGMKSLTGALVGAATLSALSEVLRRVESGHIGELGLPAGSAELMLALFLLLMLGFRPRGLTGGREVPWPGLLAGRRGGGVLGAPRGVRRERRSET
ncbi:MAG: branched-chain amino acid ABC transporter permease [Thermoleophilaceae bacterium]